MFSHDINQLCMKQVSHDIILLKKQKVSKDVIAQLLECTCCLVCWFLWSFVYIHDIIISFETNQWKFDLSFYNQGES